MIRSLLIGLVAGMRSLTPIAAVSYAAKRGVLPPGAGVHSLVSHPAFSIVAFVLAGSELVGDKVPGAPDRIVAAGLAARLLAGAMSGAALAPRSHRSIAAILGAPGAVGFAYSASGFESGPFKDSVNFPRGSLKML
jgi:uncharacterized membrane protein